MKPLEAARRMAEPRVAHWVYGDSAADKCLYCDQNGERAVEINAPLDHATDCPWLSMPRIVAALEAAGRLVEATQPTQYTIPARVICQICHSEGPDWSHTSTCAWASAKAALEG